MTDTLEGIVKRGMTIINDKLIVVKITDHNGLQLADYGLYAEKLEYIISILNTTASEPKKCSDLDKIKNMKKQIDHLALEIDKRYAMMEKPHHE